MNLLVAYYGDRHGFHKYMKKHNASSTMPYYRLLIIQMLYHGAFEASVLKYVPDGSCIPNVISQISTNLFIECLDRGITFQQGDINLGYDTIQEFPQDVHLTVEQLNKFTALTSLNYEKFTSSLWYLKLSVCKSIKRLNCPSTTSDENLARFDQIEKLNIHNNAKINMISLSNNKSVTYHLKELSLSKSIVDDKTLARFVNLQILDICECKMISFANQHFPFFDTLLSLSVSFCDEMFTDDKLEKFTRLQSLSFLQSPNELRLTTGHPLYTTITTLEITWGNVKDETLQNFHNIRNLSVRCRNITLNFLSQGHSLCDTLEELSIYDTKVGSTAINALKKLRILRTRATGDILSFLHRDHPLCDTLEVLEDGLENYEERSLISDDSLQFLRCLRKLGTDSDHVKLEFLKDPHHPMNVSLVELHLQMFNESRVLPLMNLQNLEILKTQEKLVLHPSYAICDTLLEYVNTNRHMKDDSLQHLRKLRKLKISRPNRNFLSFMNETHPLTKTLEILDCSSSGVKDENLCHLRALRELNIKFTDITLSFIDENHPLSKTLKLVVARSDFSDMRIAQLLKICNNLKFDGSFNRD